MTRTKDAFLIISLRVEVVKTVKVKSYTRIRSGKLEKVRGYERKY